MVIRQIRQRFPPPKVFLHTVYLDLVYMTLIKIYVYTGIEDNQLPLHLCDNILLPLNPELPRQYNENAGELTTTKHVTTIRW